MSASLASVADVVRLPTLPIQVNKYNRGYIYKIVNDVNDDIYVGSSCDEKRFAKHLAAVRAGKTSLLYRTMRELGVEHFKLVWIEDWPCTKPRELTAREEYQRKELKATFNSIRCHVSDEEWVEYKKKYNQKYYQENKVELLAKSKEYYEENKVEIAVYYQENKIELLAYQKVYHQEHKAERVANMKVYYQKKQKSNEITNSCSACNTTYATIGTLKTHYKSAMHLRNSPVEAVAVVE